MSHDSFYHQNSDCAQLTSVLAEAVKKTMHLISAIKAVELESVQVELVSFPLQLDANHGISLSCKFLFKAVYNTPIKYT